MRARLVLPCLGACVLALASCGGSSGGSSSGGSTAATPKPADFPQPGDRTLGELKKSLGAGPSLATTAEMIQTGRDRFGFALFDRARKQITEAPAALYAAPVVGSVASKGVVGPFPARFESLAVKPQLQSETVKSDPDAARSIYVADMNLPKKGSWALMAVSRLDDRLVASDPIVVHAGPFSVPKKGDRAISVSTPTVASVGGDVSKIDTRKPPGTMHDVNLAEALGKKPVVLVFATPALCQSRVCGPVVDIAEQEKAKWKDKVDFIHMEIYKNNELSQGFRPQVKAWHLPTEPWTFVIGKDGRVADRFSGPYSAGELDAAIQRVAR